MPLTATVSLPLTVESNDGDEELETKEAVAGSGGSFFFFFFLNIYYYFFGGGWTSDNRFFLKTYSNIVFVS